MNNLQELIKLATTVAKIADDNEKIAVPMFSVKLSQASEMYPGDYTIGMISRVITKMANSDKLAITRAEIKDLYNKFYSKNNKFAQLFTDEMGAKEEEVKQEPRPLHQEYVDLNSLVQPTDQTLAQALDQAFGGNTVKAYSQNIGKKVVSSCKTVLAKTGIPSSVEIACYDDGLFVCLASFETPKGETGILIPIETVGDAVISPEAFVGNEGPTEITKDNIVAYITSKAGQRLKVSSQEVLKASIMVRGSDNEISDVDLAVSRMQGDKDLAMSDIGITNVSVENENPNSVVNLAHYENEGLTSIAKLFDNELGFASFKYGTKVVASGSSMIARELEKAGISNYHIALGSSDNNSLNYSVSINGGSVAFKVPMSIEANAIVPPTIMICNGSISSFDTSSIKELIKSSGFDRTAAVAASPLYGIKGSDLVETVRQAMAEGNYAKAEDAINVLASSDDLKAYEKAMQVFSSSLKKMDAIQAPISKCANVIRDKHSQHDLCGHTGLPLHKVYQDKLGQCLPKYREAMENSSEGVSFLTSTAFFKS